MLTLSVPLKLRNLIIKQLLCVRFGCIELFEQLDACVACTSLFLSICAFHLHVGRCRAVFAEYLVADPAVMVPEIELEILLAIGAAWSLLVWDPFRVFSGFFVIFCKYRRVQPRSIHDGALVTLTR